MTRLLNLAPTKALKATLLTWLLAVPGIQAATILDLPIVAGHVIDNDADGFDSTDPLNLRSGYSDNGLLRVIRRGVIEFDLSLLAPGVPTGSIILSARQVSLLADGGGALQIRGYAGNGTLDLADATQTGSVLGTYTDVLNTTMNIDVTAFVADLITQGERYAGFELRGTEEGFHSDPSGFGISSASRLFRIPSLTFAAPEPSLSLLLWFASFAVIGSRTVKF